LQALRAAGAALLAASAAALSFPAFSSFLSESQSASVKTKAEPPKAIPAHARLLTAPPPAGAGAGALEPPPAGSPSGPITVPLTPSTVVTIASPEETLTVTFLRSNVSVTLELGPIVTVPSFSNCTVAPPAAGVTN